MGNIKNVLKLEVINKRVIFLPGFESDWKMIFKNHPESVQDDYINQLISLLTKLCLLGNLIAMETSEKTFKRISGCNEEIFRIRFKKKPINLRVLYYTKDDKFFVVSCCFVEKNKSDYKKNIEKAKNRYKVSKE